MKIAIYDPEPTACGLMAWTRHLRWGLRMAGHEADVVSFTWSGRPRRAWGNPVPGTMWYDRPLDLAGSYRRVAEVLAPYDGIILSTPDVGLQDREAQKEGWDLPKYARVLERSGRPFTTVLHSFMYDAKTAPFTDAILSLPNFAGTILTHPDVTRVARTPVLRSTPSVSVRHPYRPRLPVDAPVPPAGTAGTTGRFAHINGLHLTALIAALGYLPAGTDVILRGAAAVSNRASLTLEVFELLRDEFGYVGDREGGDAFRPHPWLLKREDGTIRYAGAYTDPAAACGDMTVHASLLSDKESTGCDSYVELESMDAGCTQVVTSAHRSAGFLDRVIDPLPTMPSMKFARKDQDVREWLGRAGALVAHAAWEDAGIRTETVRHNRDVLLHAHDPVKIAAVFAEVLGA